MSVDPGRIPTEPETDEPAPPKRRQTFLITISRTYVYDDEDGELTKRQIETSSFSDLPDIDEHLLWDDVKAELVTGKDEAHYREYVGLPPRE